MTNLKLFKIIFFLLPTFSLITCTDDQEGTRPYPRVQTLEVFNISGSGAVFSAEIINEGNLQIAEHGFVWGRKENPTIDYSDKRVLTNSIINNEFSSEITTTLTKDKMFFVRAYVKSGEYLVYGKNVSFVSLGSDPVIFDSFMPNTGTWGDTIKLKGKYFSFRSNQNIVRFKELESIILNSTDSTITCIVPRELSDQTVPIFLEVANEIVKSEEDFKLLLPEIISVSPINATFGDEITISGENFSRQIFDNQVYFGNARATIISSNENIIKVIVPNNLESSSEIIKVISNLQEVTYTSNFTLTPPNITFITPGIFANDEVNIQVSNFHPITSENKFAIENITSEILSGNTGNYTVKVPWGPFPRRKAKITIQLLDLITEYEFDIDILNKWILVTDNLILSYAEGLDKAVVAKGVAYIIAPSRDYTDNTFYFWKFNPTDFSWERNTLPFTIESGSIIESNGSNIYAYLPSAANDFWEYNPLTNAWINKSNFIGGKRASSTHFSIGEDIYIGMGGYTESYTRIRYKDFYKYNPSNDQWTRISDVPSSSSHRSTTASFVINGIGYFTGGATSSGDRDSWSYNPVTNTWTRIADNPYALQSGNTGFSLGGFGYVTGSGYGGMESWRYDPINNIWEQSYDIGKPRGEHFSFSLNGKAYIGGGEGLVSSEMFEFVP